MSIFTTPKAIEIVSEKTAGRAVRMCVLVRGTEMVWAHFTIYTLVKYFYDIHIIFEKFLCVLLCRHYLVSFNSLFLLRIFFSRKTYSSTNAKIQSIYYLCFVCVDGGRKRNFDRFSHRMSRGIERGYTNAETTHRQKPTCLSTSSLTFFGVFCVPRIYCELRAIDLGRLQRPKNDRQKTEEEKNVFVFITFPWRVISVHSFLLLLEKKEKKAKCNCVRYLWKR